MARAAIGIRICPGVTFVPASTPPLRRRDSRSRASVVHVTRAAQDVAIAPERVTQVRFDAVGEQALAALAGSPIGATRAAERAASLGSNNPDLDLVAAVAEADGVDLPTILAALAGHHGYRPVLAALRLRLGIGVLYRALRDAGLSALDAGALLDLEGWR